MKDLIPDIDSASETTRQATGPKTPKTATFDEAVPTLGALKKMQDPARYDKARFSFRLYPLRKDS